MTEAVASPVVEGRLVLSYKQLTCLKEEHLEGSSSSTMTHLILKHNLISEIQIGSILNLQNLYKLDLTANSLDHVPEFLFTSLPNLTVLKCGNNRIESFPAAIGRCSKLEKFEINDNYIQVVPAQYINATNNLMSPLLSTILSIYTSQSTRLDINASDITSLSERFEDSITKYDEGLHYLPPEILYLTSVTSLSMKRCNLTRIDQRICQLSQLTHLDLSHNKLNTIPTDIFNQMKNLKELKLSYNRIEQIPDCISKALSLQVLYLDHNEITSLPEALFDCMSMSLLRLDYNKLKEIPQGIERMASLRQIMASDNLIEEIPHHVYNLPNLIQFSLERNPLPQSFYIQRYCQNLPSRVGKRESQLLKRRSIILQQTSFPTISGITPNNTPVLDARFSCEVPIPTNFQDKSPPRSSSPSSSDVASSLGRRLSIHPLFGKNVLEGEDITKTIESPWFTLLDPSVGSRLPIQLESMEDEVASVKKSELSQPTLIEKRNLRRAPSSPDLRSPSVETLSTTDEFPFGGSFTTSTYSPSSPLDTSPPSPSDLRPKRSGSLVKKGFALFRRSKSDRDEDRREEKKREEELGERREEEKRATTLRSRREEKKEEKKFATVKKRNEDETSPKSTRSAAMRNKSEEELQERSGGFLKKFSNTLKSPRGRARSTSIASPHSDTSPTTSPSESNGSGNASPRGRSATVSDQSPPVIISSLEEVKKRLKGNWSGDIERSKARSDVMQSSMHEEKGRELGGTIRQMRRGLSMGTLKMTPKRGKLMEDWADYSDEKLKLDCLDVIQQKRELCRRKRERKQMFKKIQGNTELYVYDRDDNRGSVLEAGTPRALLSLYFNDRDVIDEEQYADILLLTWNKFGTPEQFVTLLFTHIHNESSIEKVIQLLNRWNITYPGSLSPGTQAYTILSQTEYIRDKLSPAPEEKILFEEETMECEVEFDLETINVERMGRQMTLIESKFFRSIPLYEYLDPSKRATKGSGISRLVDQFNRMSSWISGQILSRNSVEARIRVIHKLIVIACICLRLNNYHGAMEIMSAMESVSVASLKKTWTAIPSGDLKMLAGLRQVLNIEDNFKNVRKCTEMSRPPAIPYIGVYMQDLVFLEDAPTVVNPSKSSEEGEEKKEKLEMVNFRKIEMMGKILSCLHRLASTTYSIEEDEEMDKWLRNRTPIDPSTLSSVDNIAQTPMDHAESQEVRDLRRTKRELEDQVHILNRRFSQQQRLKREKVEIIEADVSDSIPSQDTLEEDPEDDNDNQVNVVIQVEDQPHDRPVRPKREIVQIEAIGDDELETSSSSEMIVKEDREQRAEDHNMNEPWYWGNSASPQIDQKIKIEKRKEEGGITFHEGSKVWNTLTRIKNLPGQQLPQPVRMFKRELIGRVLGGGRMETMPSCGPKTCNTIYPKKSYLTLMPRWNPQLPKRAGERGIFLGQCELEKRTTVFCWRPKSMWEYCGEYKHCGDCGDLTAEDWNHHPGTLDFWSKKSVEKGYFEKQKLPPGVDFETMKAGLLEDQRRGKRMIGVLEDSKKKRRVVSCSDTPDAKTEREQMMSDRRSDWETLYHFDTNHILNRKVS
ncbi:small GTP-binding protein [Planoprotostelium fungivorum]|uniref:Small GTP-binding protein n=1 Tax=Planoprotostelium fungivorum TaxID=1890364 RepID=A0A2P6MTF5_9EUKA|nr:small GTP-binding protein [Planoprotostelium fungivorum]